MYIVPQPATCQCNICPHCGLPRTSPTNVFPWYGHTFNDPNKMYCSTGTGEIPAPPRDLPEMPL